MKTKDFKEDKNSWVHPMKVYVYIFMLPIKKLNKNLTIFMRRRKQKHKSYRKL